MHPHSLAHRPHWAGAGVGMCIGETLCMGRTHSAVVYMLVVSEVASDAARIVFFR